MANQDVKVSALNSVSTLSTDDLSLETVVDELSETGYTSKKITEGAKASQYLEAFTFANLNTSEKTIVGAINEAATTGGSDEFIIHMTDTTVTETAADIIDAFDNGSEIWLESQITGETVKTRLPLLAYISDSSQLVLRFSGITYANNRYRYCDVQMLRSPEQIVGRQNVNVAFAVIDDASTSSSSVWSSQKTASELADKAEIDDTAVSSSTAWSSEQIVSLLPTESASGAVASFETPLTLPLVSHNVTIEPVQEGTGDPSPSNVRPISGWSAVNITRTGINIWGGQKLADDIVFLVTDAVIDSTLKRVTYTGQKINNVVLFNKFKPNTSYTFFISAASGVSNLKFYYTDNTSQMINNSGVTISNSGKSVSYIGGSWNTGTTVLNYEECGVLEGELTVDDFEPYTGITVTITLGQTVYVCTLDVINGVLTIIGQRYNLGDLTWTIHQNGFYQATKPEDMARYDMAIVPDIVAEKYKAQTGQWVYAHGSTVGYIGQNGGLIYVTDSTTPSGYIVAPLATPVEVTLTPEHISTLKGVNNIWADTGDTAVEFKQDIQTYIDSRLSSRTRSLSLAKAPVEEETKQEEQEGENNER